MIRKLALLSVLAPALALAQAARIEVGAPNFKPLPIAVAPFLADGAAEGDAAEIQQLVAWDLHVSGLFQVLDAKSFLAPRTEGISAPEIAYQRWTDVGAQGLVKARVRRAGGEVAADARLHEVGSAREVLAREIRGMTTRGVAHQLADEIIRYYTREPGVFSTRIAAVRMGRGTRDLVVYDADGRAGEVVLQDKIILLPAWRPDGGAIAYTSYRGGKPELWIVELGTRQTRKLASVGELTTAAAWSPDGTRVAFAASQGGNSDVYVANADGSGVQRLTRDPATDGSPSWSPDGKRIAFVSSRSGNPHVFVMNADGSDQRRLTFEGNYNQTPRWSPRGDLIAFTGRDERKVFDIFVVPPDGGRTRRVTQDQGRTNWEPTWAPNGRLLAFTSDRNGRAQLVVSTVDGNRQTVVTSESLDLATPAWGPLGR
ncbi:MAG TPA: Tol-Pal system beta propeller repeat protein TolB [Anaeromyxobacteraceae bacterium]|nr:Tol-Pal system beta propeller repeat protein TolB [Anaeromyxobacteraceae bacterium]